MRAWPLALLLTFAGIAGCLSGDDTPNPAPGPAMDVPVDEEANGRPGDAMQLFERFEERPAGVEREMRFLYGPFTIPPGQDMNRVTAELPVNGGFLTAVSPNLYFMETGETPTNQHMHIHHAHWFRTSDDPDDEYYTANLAWVFGTGEERTSGSFHDRADADPDGPRYGIYIEALQPQALIYMLHNKDAVVRNVYVALDVTFLYGDAAAVRAATSCPGLMDGERCHAGKEVHHVTGKLWGTTFDVPREPVADGGDGEYIHPIDIAADWPTRRATDDLGRYHVASTDGTLIASAGHLHPNGKEVVVANLGPEGSACEADLDGDGFPGVTLFHSRKIEQVPGAFPHSEEYQMGATKFGYRAPIREGDRITQFAVYANDHHASYAAMSFVGMYVDRLAPPEPRGPEGCTMANTAPVLLPGDPRGGDPIEGTWNRAWGPEVPPHCGLAIGFNACDKELTGKPPEGLEATVIQISDFLYAPGDQSLAGQPGAPVRVTRGAPLLFVNEDAAAGIRHTVTSCQWPCNGPYVANYPHPDGSFHSGKLGNVDPIDGGGIQADPDDPLGFSVAGDMLPYWLLDTSDLEPGYYAFFCHIHPWMRGWIEVV
jgi:hypothetical protein